MWRHARILAKLLSRQFVAPQPKQHMPKEPITANLYVEDVEATVEKAATGAIEEALPSELRGQAVSALQSILEGTRRRPVAALALATAVGYAVALLLDR